MNIDERELAVGMPRRMSDIWLAVLAHGAPLLGIALWLTPFSLTPGGGGAWDLPKMFTL